MLLWKLKKLKGQKTVYVATYLTYLAISQHEEIVDFFGIATYILLYIGNHLRKKMFTDFVSLGAFANIFLYVLFLINH